MEFKLPFNDESGPILLHCVTEMFKQIEAQIYDRKLIKVRDFYYYVNDPRHWGRRVLPDIRQNRGMLAKALFTFEAEAEAELSFSEGDELLIYGEMGNGWLSAKRMSDSKTGIIPENYVEFCGGE